MPTGLYVVGTRDAGRRNLMTVSWATQVATEPKLVGISVESTSVTHSLLVDGRVFALSILPREARPLVRRFAKPVTDVSIDESTLEGTMEDESVYGASTGAPVLAAAVAWLDCEVRHVFALGSHSLFVGEVVDCGESSPGQGQPAAGPPAAGGAAGVLRMEDTRMNYGG
jgi:flavin reductase (DIM6/NTAB) family NADH-FMN oxidoreductase RutF